MRRLRRGRVVPGGVEGLDPGVRLESESDEVLSLQEVAGVPRGGRTGVALLSSGWGAGGAGRPRGWEAVVSPGAAALAVAARGCRGGAQCNNSRSELARTHSAVTTRDTNKFLASNETLNTTYHSEK